MYKLWYGTLGSIVRHSEECYNSVVFDASAVVHWFMLYAWHRMKREELSRNIFTTPDVGQDRLRPPAVAACLVHRHYNDAPPALAGVHAGCVGQT